MAADRYIWIVQIAGLGRDGLTSSNSTTRERIEAMALATASTDAQPNGSICDEWQPLIVPGSLSMGEMSFGPLTGKVASSTLSFALTLRDDRPEIGRFFLAPVRAKQPILLMDRGEEIAPDDTSAAFSTIEPGASLASLGVAEGSILYNGREALRVASVNDTTDTITFVDQIPDPASAGTSPKSSGVALQRGQIGTYLGTHTASAVDDLPPFADNRWFDVSPFCAGREVRLLRYDGESASETVWWRGMIDGEPTLASDGVTLTVKCCDIFQAMKDAQINRRGGRGTASKAFRPGDTTFLQVKDRPVRSQDSLYREPAALSEAVYQVGSSAITGFYTSVSQAGSDFVLITSGPSAFGGELLDVEDGYPGTSTVRINELLVSDPLDGTSPATNIPLIASVNHPLYCTDLPDRADIGTTRNAILDHPVMMALAFMRGLTCPNLPDHWTVPIPTEYLDVDSFTAMAYTGPYAAIDQWPGLVAGKDGKPIKFWKFVTEELLSGLGIGLAYGDPADGKGGQIVVKSLFAGNANIEGSVTLSQLVAGRGATIQTRLAADNLVVNSGQGIGDSPRFISILSALYDESFFPYDTGNVELSTPGLVHPDDETDIDQSPRVDFLIGLYRQFADLLRTPLVTVRRTVTADKLLYPGQWVTISNTGGIDPATGTTDTSTAAKALGVVIKVTPDLSGALDQTVELYLLPFGLSRIGPAGEVDTATTSTVTLQADEFLGPESPYAPADGISVTADAGGFEVGQKVLLLDSTLEKMTQVEEISGISGNVITITGTWTATGGGAYSPSAGDILTLADFSDSEDEEQTTYAFIAEDEWML